MALIKKSQMSTGPGDGKYGMGPDPKKDFEKRYGKKAATGTTGPLGPTTLENFMEAEKNKNMTTLANSDPLMKDRFGDQGRFMAGMGYRGRFMKDATGKELYVLAPMQDAKGSYTKEGDKQVAFVYVDGSKNAKKAFIKDGVITDYESGGREGGGGYSAQDVISDAWSRYSAANIQIGEQVHEGGKVEMMRGGKKVFIQTSGAEGASTGTGTGVKADEWEQKAGEKTGIKGNKGKKTPTFITGAKSKPSDKPKK
jgi:hypothetical protein